MRTAATSRCTCWGNNLAKYHHQWHFAPQSRFLENMLKSQFNNCWSARLAALLISTTLLADAAELPAPRFGFTGPEIFPIDYGFNQLHSGDLDGDGKLDLIVVNNARSKITLLYNRTGQTNAAASTDTKRKREINELPLDARFRLESIASEKRIASLVVTDLNGDGKPDLAYYGEPKELVVQYNQGTNGWSQPKRWPIDDGQLTPNALTHGDLNNDKRTDLVLLAENTLYVFTQGADHTLGEPEKIPFSGSVKSVQVLDIDGDGRDDLLLVNWDGQNPFRFRLQNAPGRYGPEIHFAVPPVRSYWADDLDGDRKMELMTIAQNSGRAQVSNFRQKPSEALSGALLRGQLHILPLNRTDKDRRGMTWADLNGDGRTDLLVAEPGSGQLTVYLQTADGALSVPKTFPTFTGVTELAVADWDGDGKGEIFLLSSDERQVGFTRLDTNGRVAFPKVMTLDGKPLAIAVGALQPGAKPTLAIIIDQDGKRSLVLQTSDGALKTQKLGDNFKSNPASLAIHDADQDGLADLIVLIPYEKLKVLRQVEGKDFEESDITPPGGNADQPWLSVADVDGDGKAELMLAQKNFLRAVVLQQDSRAAGKAAWGFTVKEQINGAASNSRIVGAAPIKSGTNQTASLFLLDAERKALTLCERDKAGVWQVVRNMPMPATDFNGLRAISHGKGTQESLALVGINQAAWQAFQGSVWEISELDGYETPIKDGRLLDVVTGDLNQDKRKDLVFLEVAKNHIDIVTFDKNRKMIPTDRWQVFEERTFRSRRSDLPEPREALVADVTGDGKNDLIVVVHDRILVYPQE
jgi:hypothetical protein